MPFIIALLVRVEVSPDSYSDSGPMDSDSHLLDSDSDLMDSDSDSDSGLVDSDSLLDSLQHCSNVNVSAKQNLVIYKIFATQNCTCLNNR